MTRVKIRLSSERSLDKAHRDILSALEAAIDAADPRKIIRRNVKLIGSTLHVQSVKLALRQFNRILVIGAGKASGYMGEELEKILGTRITDGTVIVPDYLRPTPKGRRIKYRSGTHPVPSKRNLVAVDEMLKTVKDPGHRDLVIVLVSGGASALMDLPIGGVSLTDERKLTSLLLKSGATIQEINIVRKHLSQVKGGRLAQLLNGATVLTLIISDVVGDRLDSIGSGPTVPDASTYQDASAVLRKYNLWSRTPARVRSVIERGLHGSLSETPKIGNPAFRLVNNMVLGSNRESCRATTSRLTQLGYRAINLSTRLSGEARVIGGILGSIANGLRNDGMPFMPPAAIVFGGETTVTVTGRGKGGRNQELALAAADKLDGLSDVIVASFATDGVDGPTNSAGAIADGRTIARGKRAGLDSQEYLGNNDSNSYFAKLGDLIQTGPTGTNVNDITIVLAA